MRRCILGAVVVLATAIANPLPFPFSLWFPEAHPMPTPITNYPVSTDDWPSSGTALASEDWIDIIAGTWTYGEDSDGKYLQDDGTAAGSNYVVIGDDASVAAAFADGVTVEFSCGVKFVASDGAPAGSAITNGTTLFWFSADTLTLRYQASDFVEGSGYRRLNDDGSISALRLAGNTNGRDGGTIGTLIPTNRLLEYRIRVTRNTSTDFDVYHFINGELVGWNEGVNISAYTARIPRIRSIGEAGNSDNLRARWYGPFTAVTAPDDIESTPTGTHYKHLPLPVNGAHGLWTPSGTITYQRTVDQSNDPDGYALAPRVLQTRLPMVTMASGATLITKTELGDALFSSRGSGCFRVPLIWLSASTARLDLNFYAPESSSEVVLSLRFNGSGTVQQGAGSGAISYQNLTDESGATMSIDPSEAYEAVVHFDSGGKACLSLHCRSKSITAAATLTAGRCTAGSLTGIPTLGDVEFEAGGTGTADVATPILQREYWLAGFSSYVHRNDLDGNPSYFGSGSRVLGSAQEYGQDIGWGNEIPGVADLAAYVDHYSAVGRSGSDLADFETNNPAWSLLLPLMPATRLVSFDCMVNHLIAARTTDELTEAARDEVLEDVEAILDACVDAGAAFDFVEQFPLPVGAADDAGTDVPQRTADAMNWLNTQIPLAMSARGRSDLFTVARVRQGETDGEVFDIEAPGVDRVHLSQNGQDLVYLRGLSSRAPAGGGRTRGRDRVR